MILSYLARFLSYLAPSYLILLVLVGEWQSQGSRLYLNPYLSAVTQKYGLIQRMGLAELVGNEDNSHRHVVCIFNKQKKPKKSTKVSNSVEPKQLFRTVSTQR